MNDLQQKISDLSAEITRLAEMNKAKSDEMDHLKELLK